jgi:oxygen-independent coproporphyrinogen-3 oxidase
MEISTELINKYTIAVPRYTSYPPANHFRDNFSGEVAVRLIEESNHDKPSNIALYIHIPFCKKICFYCGCNTALMKEQQTVEAYVNALKQELRMVAGHLDSSRKVTQVHYGGGTPNSIDVRYLEELNQLIFDLFEFIPAPEIAIECHPAHLDELYLQRLLNAGFNRFSIGVQDFSSVVLAGVNRAEPALPVAEILQFLKFSNPAISVNLDFMYGLPGQTVENFTETIQQAIAIRPDRLVTFSYAHVPWIKKHQQILEKKGLPGSNQKMELFLASRKLLTESGYQAIGLDHYVLPGDELFTALVTNQLHRNFQGYCTRRTTGQVYAVGVSSISQLEKVYFQNVKDVPTYIDRVLKGQLPVDKGLEVNEQQRFVRAVIEQIMCNKRLDISGFCSQRGIAYEEFARLTGFDSVRLEEMIADGLVRYENTVLDISEKGSFFIRNIACLFDPDYPSLADGMDTAATGRMYSQSV